METGNELNLLATSIRRCAAGMNCWSIQEITLGLYRLFKQHTKEGAVDTIPGSRVDDLGKLEELRYWLKWAMSAYLPDGSAIAKYLQINEVQIKKHVYASAVLRPSYLIAVDDLKHSIVLVVRGTHSVTDIMTDLNPHSEKFEKGYAHSGILSAARWLMKEELENLEILLKAHPGYNLVLTGHSLGAATASLLCLLLEESFSKSEFISGSICNKPVIMCWGFGSPPCLDKESSEQSTNIKNVVLQDDIIARLCPSALDCLRIEISKMDWRETFGENSKLRKVVELVQTTHGFVNNLEASLGYENGHFSRQIKSLCYSSFVSATNQLSTPATNNCQATNSSAGTTLSKWLSYGARNLFQNADKCSASISTSSQVGREVVASSTMSAPAASDEGIPSPDNLPLYVPGMLYHILRKKDQNSLAKESASASVSTTTHVDTVEVVGNDKSVNDSINAQYYVICGDDPPSRFSRIVLSNSMISDHSCQSYLTSLDNVVESTQRTMMKA